MRATDATTKEAMKARILVFINVPFGMMCAYHCAMAAREGASDFNGSFGDADGNATVAESVFASLKWKMLIGHGYRHSHADRKKAD